MEHGRKREDNIWKNKEKENGEFHPQYLHVGGAESCSVNIPETSRRPKMAAVPVTVSTRSTIFYPNESEA